MQIGSLWSAIGLGLLAISAACSSNYSLTMVAELPPLNDSVLTSSASPMLYSSVIVIPPSGTVRGEFDAIVALFERELLKKGMKVTSGAITGRVVFAADGETDGKRRVEGGAQLSDAERALILAEQANADAILQIGTWTWSSVPQDSRFLILDPARFGETFFEVPRSEYEQWRGLGYSFSSQSLDFIGRLTDVKSGQVIAAFKIKTYANWHLPSQYSSTIQYHDGSFRADGETFKYANGTWIPAAKERAEAKVIELVMSSLGTGK